MTTQRAYNMRDKVVLAPPTQVFDEDEVNSSWLRGLLPPDEHASEPITALYYPIFQDSELVGFLIHYLFFRDMIRDLLPQDAKGLYAVFESKCTSSFTYAINGYDVKYLGKGDHHKESLNKFHGDSFTFHLGASVNNDPNMKAISLMRRIVQ